MRFLQNDKRGFVRGTERFVRQWQPVDGMPINPATGPVGEPAGEPAELAGTRIGKSQDGVNIARCCPEPTENHSGQANMFGAIGIAVKQSAAKLDSIPLIWRG
jgi:hypothetical protein